MTRIHNKHNALTIALFSVLLILLQTSLDSKTSLETGLKYYHNYTPQDYEDQPQNWCIAQGKHGIIYVANSGGVLEFDGISWRCIEITNLEARSLAIDKSGTIFVGGYSDLGYLKPDDKGNLIYQSLIEHIQEDRKLFKSVNRIHCTSAGTFFYTAEFIFRWHKNQMFSWQTNRKTNRFDGAFYAHGKYFVRKRSLGLFQASGNDLIPVQWNKRFTSARIFVILPLDAQRLLIGTRDEGFYIEEKGIIKPFQTGMQQYFKEKKLTYGITLPTGDLALATLEGGLIILDKDGNLKRIIDSEFGLPVNNVKYVFNDAEGNLWLALNKGITKIEYSSPISFYNDRTGLLDLVLSVHYHNGTLYAGAYTGLYALSPQGKFEIVQGITSPCWSILSTGDSLLAATTHGLWQVDRSSKTLLVEGSAHVLVRSNVDKNRIWVGRPKGLLSLIKKTGSNRWQLEHVYKEIKNALKTIVEDPAGFLWIGPRNKNVLKVEFQNDDPLRIEVTKFDKTKGLPDLPVKVFKIKNRPVFATGESLFRYDEGKDAFVPDKFLGKRFEGGEEGDPVYRIAEDIKGNIWINSNNRNILAIPKPDGTYHIDENSMNRMPPVQTNAIYPSPDGNLVYFATHDGLTCYDNRTKKDFRLNYSSSFRSIDTNGTVRYGGHGLENPKTPGQADNPVVLDYKDNDIRIKYAALFYGGTKAIRYKYHLEGFEDEWSEWTERTEKDYTNLYEGNYIFHLKTENVYKTNSNEIQFHFIIKPPLHRTWWAITLYVIAGFFVLFLAFKWRSRKLILEKERLEKIIGERTQEIKDKNLQLENQSEKLKEMDIIKSRFFANISHEFRTPLTLLMGPLEQMVDDCPPTDTAKKHKLILMLRNAQRLLRLINQLLELSKLDSGKMKLQAVKTPVTSFIKGIADSFRFMAQQKELELIFHASVGEQANDDCYIYIDPRKMEDVMSNLLVNALKFTPPGGRITVTVTPSDDTVQISVHDTGPGIPKDQLGHIFDRFYQAEHHYETPEKGSGIGLSLCKELIQLHHGSIEVESRKGEGTAFTIRLPKGKEHLLPSDLAQPGAIANGAGMHMDEFMDQTQEKTEEPDAATIAIDSTEPHKEIILVVEDSTDMREYIKVALEPDYKVVEAGDGQEGLEKARNLIPDLIVSDIMMPNMNGYELCKTLKSDRQTSHIPVILLTAKASEEHIVEGLETGADDYVTKPFSMTILSARIKNLIDIRRQLQQNVNREMALQPVKTKVSTIDREFLDELQGVLKEHMPDPEFNVEQLCKKLYMGNTTLYRKINALCGQTPTDFIRSYRLKRAAELLRSGFGSVTEVAFEVGFSSRAYFTKCFKEKFHTLPSSYASGGQ